MATAGEDYDSDVSGVFSSVRQVDVWDKTHVAAAFSP